MSRRRQSSSSSPAVTRGLITPESLLYFTDDTAKARLERLQTLRFRDCRKFDWTVLRSLHIDDAIHDLVSDLGWNTFFNIDEEGYSELTLEFLCTLERAVEGDATGMEYTYSFRLGLQQFTITVSEFNTLLGFYTPDFCRSPAFRRLRTSFPPGLDPASIWPNISNDLQAYEAKRSKASSLASPALRIVHHLLSHTLSGRGESSGVVGTKDVLYLYSMIEGYPLNMGFLFLQYLLHQAEYPRIGAICVAPYVTCIARALGVFADLPPMQVVARMAPITLGSLTATGIVQSMDIQGVKHFFIPGFPPVPASEFHAAYVAAARPPSRYSSSERGESSTTHSGVSVDATAWQARCTVEDERWEQQQAWQQSISGHLGTVMQNQTDLTGILDALGENQQTIMRNQSEMLASFHSESQYSADYLSYLGDRFDEMFPQQPGAPSRSRPRRSPRG